MVRFIRMDHFHAGIFRRQSSHFVNKGRDFLSCSRCTLVGGGGFIDAFLYRYIYIYVVFISLVYIIFIYTTIYTS